MTTATTLPGTEVGRLVLPTVPDDPTPERDSTHRAACWVPSSSCVLDAAAATKRGAWTCRSPRHVALCPG